MNVTRSLTADHYLVTHSVGPSQNGIRLDSFLKERYQRRSREQLKRAIDAGVITVKRRPVAHLTVGKPKPSSHLIPGDEVLVLTERKPEPPVCFDYKILFQDDSIFIIDKPPMLPVHPAGKYFFNTLLVHLKTQGHQLPLRNEQDFYLVHRIDKETSGVLVLAKDKAVCAHITRQFAERLTQKKYLAIVKGKVPEEFTVDLAMQRANRSLIDLKMMISPEEEGGQTASTYFKRLSVHSIVHQGVPGIFSLVECTPRTGRQHQIRLHLESAGHPIIGDKLYGLPESEAVHFYDRSHLSAEAEAKLLMPRHALHAHSIEFLHPVSRQRLTFCAPLPQDMADFLHPPSKRFS